MEIHFYESQLSVPANVDQYYGWMDTIRAIAEFVPEIHTTQIGLLHTNLLEGGYRIFVHPYDDEPYEIKLGVNECTDRDIKMEYNLFNLWKSGEFF